MNSPDEVWWSGRRDSNPRHLAWEASTLPLSYARTLLIIARSPDKGKTPEVEVGALSSSIGLTVCPRHQS